MIPLFKHQDDAISFILRRKGSGALFLDCGLGKTRVALEAYKEVRLHDSGLKLLVIGPLSLLNAAWRADIAKFTDLSFLNLHDNGSIPDEWPHDVWAINYESFIAEKNYRKLCSYMSKTPVMVVCDESSRMKNFKSKTTKSLLAIRDLAKYRIVMSGTPAPNTPMEYWAQMEFVNRGILHPSFYAFRNSYFHLSRGKEIANLHGQYMNRDVMSKLLRTGFKYNITDDNRKKLMAHISPYCFTARKEDCLDLPESIDEIRSVCLGPKQLKAYLDMKRHLITEIKGSDITAQAALTKILKLREITSGFAFDSTGEVHEIGENAKLDDLKDVIDEIGDRPVIIWANFKYDIRTIADTIAKMRSPDSVVTLYSETDDRDVSIDRFKDGSAQYLVANTKSAAHGLTFTNCSYEVFYSLDYSYESYHQAKARIHRAGQVNKCTYLHLIADGTIDADMLDVLNRKADMTEILYRMAR